MEKNEEILGWVWWGYGAFDGGKVDYLNILLKSKVG